MSAADEVPQPLPDAHVEAVRSDYNQRVGQWQTIYAGQSFHDHTIQQRLIRTLALVDAHGPGTGGALDVGCGAGQLALELAERGYGVAAVDIAEGMVEATTERLTAAGHPGDVRLADVTDLPFATGSFQWVTALGVIEYLTDTTLALAELSRVLAPGGRLVVTTPNPVRLSFLADPIQLARGFFGPPTRGYPRRYSHVWRLRREVRAAGLAIEQVQGHGIGAWTVAGRPVLSEERSIRIGMHLEPVLPKSVAAVLGANLIALARKPF